MDERESALMLANVRLNSLRRALDKYPADQPVSLADDELQRLMSELLDSLAAAQVNDTTSGLVAFFNIGFKRGQTLRPDSAAGLRTALKHVATSLEKAGEQRSHLRLV